jgi:hypothetical protein
VCVCVCIRVCVCVCNSNNTNKLNPNELNPKQAEDMMSNLISFHGSLRLVDKVSATQQLN